MLNDEDFEGLQGPIELIDGHWRLRIPLFMVSQKFVDALPPTVEIQDDIIEITIPGQIVPNMGLMDGEFVWVGFRDGLFTFEGLPKDGDDLN
jgi:hypothetical protein